MFEKDAREWIIGREKEFPGSRNEMGCSDTWALHVLHVWDLVESWWGQEERMRERGGQEERVVVMVNIILRLKHKLALDFKGPCA